MVVGRWVDEREKNIYWCLYFEDLGGSGLQKSARNPNGICQLNVFSLMTCHLTGGENGIQPDV